MGILHQDFVPPSPVEAAQGRAGLRDRCHPRKSFDCLYPPGGNLVQVRIQLSGGGFYVQAAKTRERLDLTPFNDGSWDHGLLPGTG